MMAFLRERGLDSRGVPLHRRRADRPDTSHRDTAAYLESEDRGLAPLSILRYLTTARLFLTGLPEPLTATLQ